MKRYKKLDEAITSQSVKANLRRPGIKMLALMKKDSDIKAYSSIDKKNCYSCQWGHEIHRNWQKCINTRVYDVITHSDWVCDEWNKEYKDIQDKPLEVIG